MALGIKVCKVCGREYEACHTLRPNINSEFRWQDVACSPEHGAEYLRMILASRQPAAPQAEAASQKDEPMSEPTPGSESVPKKRTKKKKESVDLADEKEMA